MKMARMSRWLMLMVLVALALGAGTYAAVRYGAYRLICARVCPSHQSLHELLDLTPAQNEQVLALEQESSERRAEIRAQIYEHRQELYQMLREPAPDRDAIDYRIEQIATLQAQMQHVAIDHLLQVLEILDQQQRDTLLGLLGDVMCPGGMAEHGTTPCVSNQHDAKAYPPNQAP